jgi:hypothetical protein
MQAITSTKDYLFGPPSSLKFNNVELGGSEDPAKLSIKVTRFKPKFQGASTAIAGLSRITGIEASLTVKLNDLSLAKLQLILQRVTATIGTAATTDPSGLTTTLAADADAGATSIVLTAATNIADGKFLLVGDEGETEICEVDASWSSGTTIPLTTPLIFAHDAGDAVVMVDDAGTTILEQTVGIIAEADHHDLVMQAVGPDGEPTVVTITDAHTAGDVECSFGESDTSGTSVTFVGYADKAAPTKAPFTIEKMTA